MRITTLVKNYFTYFVLFVSLLGCNEMVYSQCPTVTNSSQTFCDTQSPTVASLAATNNGGGLRWYAASTGGTALSNSLALNDGVTYYADSNPASCSPRPSVTVTIYSKPTTVGGISGIPLCRESTIADLASYMIGNQIKWYLTATGGTQLASTTTLVNNTTYYASQTNPNTGCESSRRGFTVTITIVNTPTGDASQTFCSSSSPTVANLVANGTNLLWYITPNSGIELSSATPLVDGQVYYAESNVGNCSSATRLAVTVAVFEPNDAGTNGSRSICINQVPATPPFNLFPLLGGTPNTNGTWSGPIATTNGSQGTIDPSTMTVAGSPYVFTYTIPATKCPAVSSTVTITISPLPTATVSATPTTICSGSPSTITFTGTPNATVTYNINGGNSQTITLNASGTATITNTFTANTTINIVSVASSGTPSCINTQTSSTTITVAPLPTATVSATPTTICSGSPSTITFTGTPNATVTYNINGGNSQTITLNASGTATITNTFTANTTINIVSVASSGTPSCINTQTSSTTITVAPLPTATVSATPTTICSGSPSAITFTGTPNATVTYNINGGTSQTITLNASGTATITNTFTTNTTINIVSVASSGTPSCVNTQTSSTTITVAPLPTASVSATPTTICSGSPSTITFTGTPNATVTYNINGGTSQTITLNASGTATITNTFTANTTINIVNVASSGTPSCVNTQTSSTTITVAPLPTASVSATPTTICSGSPSTITFTGTPNATVTYNINGGTSQTITLNASGTATIINTFTANTTINIVSVASSGTPSCINTQTSSTTITVAPLPTATVSATPTTICSGSPSTITFTGTPNATVTYNINGGTSQTITLNASGTATITNTFTANTTINIVSVASSGTPSCINTQTRSMTITVAPLPTATVSATPTTICSGSPSTITFTGTPNATVTYNINGGTSQTITLNASGTATITNTFTANTTINIVSVASSGTPSCVNTQTSSTTITVAPLPTATVSATPTTICSGSPSTISFTGTPNATVTYNINGGTSQTITLNASGTATITNTFTANTTINIVSEASSGTPSCINTQTSSTTITVAPLPTASVSATPTTICSGSSSTITFTGTPNATVTYNINGGTSQTITLNASGTATITNTFTANTTINIVSVASSGTPSCINTQTSSTTITVAPLPTASVSATPTTICSGSPSTITFTGTPNVTVTYNINGGTSQTIMLNASGTATITNTFTANTTINIVSVASSGTPSCINTQTSSTTITVAPLPTATVSATPTTICSGSPSTITFTGTPNATVTYNINGGTNQTITLNASGTAAITNTFTANTTINIVSVASSGTPSCLNTQTSSTTITVAPLPTATVSATPTTICSGSPSTITFTGTPNATVTYNINGGTSQTITLNASGTATITNTFTANTTINIVSVASSGTPSCVNTQTSSMTITVAPLPTATVSATPTTICSGSPSTITFTGTPNATVTYNINGGTSQTITLNASGTATITNTFTDNTTINIVSVASSGTPSCVNTQTSSTTITVAPLPTATVSATPTTICSGSPSTITFTGTPNATVTYNINGGTNQTIILNASGTATITNTFTANTTINIVSVASSGTPSCVNTQTSNTTITVAPLPTATVSATPTTICSGSPSTITFTGTPNATVTYNINGGTSQTITLNASGTATITNTFTANTTINIVSVASSGTPSCINTQTSSTTITVAQPPVAGTNGTLTVCVLSPSVDLFSLLGSTAQTGGTWSPALASGTGVFNPAVDAAGTYTYTVSGSSVCPDAAATVQVTVKPVPDAGNDGTLNICSNQNPVDLFASLSGTPQTGGTWSPALASGTGIFNPAVDAATTYTYTVTGTAPCTSDTATVAVTVTQGPEAGANNTLVVCVNNPPQDLFFLLGSTAQPGGTWSPALASGTGVFDPAVDAATTYTYTLSGTTPCSNDSATVTVTVNPIPNAGTNGTKTFCSNGTSEDLFLSLGGTPQAGGTWSPALASGTGVFNPTVDTAGTYTYTVGSTCVTPSMATVMVTITAAPNSGGAGQTVTTCANVTSFDLTAGLNGTQGTGTWNDDDATGALTNNLFNASTAGVGTYHFTYTVTGTAPCANATSTVTVTVNPLPNAGTAITPPSVCTSVGTVDLNTLLTGQDAGGTWSAPTPVNVSAFAAGTYTYTYSVTNSCGTATTNVQFIILPNPVLASTNIANATACVGTDAVINLSGMADGTYSLNYSLSGSNTLANQTATVTISGGTGSLTIPATSLPNTGSTTITFNTIQNTTSTCQSTLTNVTGTITVNPLVGIDNTNVAVFSICLGSDAVVEISNATNLPDGTYQFGYTIPGGTPATGNSGNLTITGGDGQFNVPSTVFATAGTYTITISGITTTSGCSNTTQDASITFAVVTPLTAGTAVAAPSFCNAVGTVDLNTLLTGQDTGGTWSTSSPVDISALAPGTYTYTYTVSNACGADTEDVQFIILPNPVLTAANVAATTACIGVDATVNLSGMADGTYTLNYDLSGSNTLANQMATVTISGGTGSFTIPAAGIPNAGATTITFNTIQNTASTCQSTLTNVTGTITVNPVVQIDNTNLAVASVCLNSNATVLITNATNLPDGTYQFAYTIPTGTPSTGNSGDVVITAGAGQFTIPATVFAAVGNYTLTINGITTTSGCSNTSEDANITFAVEAPLTAGTAVTPAPSVCASVGIMDLNSLLTGQSAGGVWTDSTSAVVTSPVNIIGFAAGIYTYTYTVTNSCGSDSEAVSFTVLATPQLTTVNVTTSPTCIGSGVVVNLNGMADGTYTLNYDLSGSNTLAGQSAVVTIAAGIGNFTIPAASVALAGTTVVTFTSIVNNTTTCAATLTNVAVQIIIRPLADIDNANLAIANVCLGNSVVVTINGATNLPDDVYQFNYSIPGATPVTGNSGNVTITGGAGQFTIPATAFTTAGNYTLTVVGIIATTGCTNANENATANFTINALPNTAGATVSAGATCINLGSEVTISGASSLPDGTYTVTYLLSGANSGTGTISITFTNGTATFTIPGTNITNNGQTTIAINDLASTATTCGITGTSFPSATFTVASLPMPVLADRGNLFCGLDVPAPTIASLSANIVGTPTMIWYDQPTGGTAYSPTDLLVNGTTYYGAVVSANGCESTRIPVLVDLTICDIVIPDGFSPNNDGINDTFEIPNLAIQYPNFKIEIFNRYGNIVYRGNKNVPNWDGTTTVGGLNLGDKLLPTGVYFYVLEFNDGTRKPVQGRLYLNR